MAAIDDIVNRRIKDTDLKRALLKAIEELKQQKKFGLVFEDHLPEYTFLYDVPVREGCLVAKRFAKDDEERSMYYCVKKIDEGEATCIEQTENKKEVVLPLDDIIVIALFGQPIYPSLIHMDEVRNAPDSDLWHTLIEAENYHALQLLEYLYAGKVDCIYIDPPYNTGDRSWKYNNDYVDSNDSYRHSKWLSMMKKRLLLAKKLLNPQDSVLIVTIDEKEYLRLGCLLEELFPEFNIQMVSSVINSAGVSRGEEFSRSNEFIFFIKLGKASPFPLPLSDEWRGNMKKTKAKKLVWNQLMRAGTNARRIDRKDLFYPLFVNYDGNKIVEIGDPLPYPTKRDTIEAKPNTKIIWPIRSNKEEGNWQLQPTTLKRLYDKGYVKLGRFTANGMALSYLKEGEQKKVENGIFRIIGKREDGSVIEGDMETEREYIPGTQWDIPLHNATYFGSQLLNKVIGEKRFEFPKSLYAVHDAIRFFVANKPNALIVDFFAGSGTTLHAVNLLNAEDGGHRQCIMVTNNEVSAEEEDRLKAAGYHPGQEEWDKWGIARYVNWPRTKCSILGVDVNGEPLKGNYQTYLKQEKEKERTIRQITLIDDPSSLKTAQKKELVALCCQGKLPQNLVKADSKFIVSEEHPCSILFDINYAEEWLDELDGQDHITELFIVTRNTAAFKQLKEELQNLLGNIVTEEPVVRPMSEGFKANVKYFRLGFLDKNAVELHRQFKELLPMLWMKAGAKGECPQLDSEVIPDYMICEQNRMAILVNDTCYADFRNLLKGRTDIETIYFVEDSDYTYQSMVRPFHWAKTYQLYRDYLDNFTINYERH